MKVKGPQQMPAIFEPHSLKGQRSCMDDGRCGFRCGLRLEIRTESTLAHPALRELTRMQR